MKIAGLKPRQAVDEVSFKVIELGEERTTSGGNRVVEALVGDETGVVKFTLWNAEISMVEVGKTYSLKNGYVTLFRGSMRLTIGRNGELNLSDSEIEDVNLENNMSEKKYLENFNRQRFRGKGGFRRSRTGYM